VKRPERLTDVFGSVKNYLGEGFRELDTIYTLEKAGEFQPGTPRPRGTEVITGQLARAAGMLGSLWYTAWLESGEPVPTRQ
jgi:hypothetical protein